MRSIRERREIAVDDSLQVRHAASVPVLQLLRRKEVHADEDVNWCHDRVIGGHFEGEITETICGFAMI